MRRLFPLLALAIALLSVTACHRKWSQPDAGEFVPSDEKLQRRTPAEVKREVNKQVDVHQKKLDEATDKGLQ